MPERTVCCGWKAENENSAPGKIATASARNHPHTHPKMMKPKSDEKGTNRKLLKSSFDLSSSHDYGLPRSKSYGLGAPWSIPLSFTLCVSLYLSLPFCLHPVHQFLTPTVCLYKTCTVTLTML